MPCHYLSTRVSVGVVFPTCWLTRDFGNFSRRRRLVLSQRCKSHTRKVLREAQSLTFKKSQSEAQEGLLLVAIMPHGTTINSDAYVATLKKLQARLSCVRQHREKQDVLLLHDNAQPYVSLKTTDQIRKFG
ncbi:hypothetical protein ANN_13875 [Periplaneta americana]|uniref:Mariner Mos1 transposase n=1 Tax=Periplaneta americana TaxID=6978 RepID=A0ABQ8SUR0_PERAM|nr:hypothetical protein ANN_13875 [Periplaneta americana]